MCNIVNLWFIQLSNSALLYLNVHLILSIIAFGYCCNALVTWKGTQETTVRYYSFMKINWLFHADKLSELNRVENPQNCMILFHQMILSTIVRCRKAGFQCMLPYSNFLAVQDFTNCWEMTFHTFNVGEWCRIMKPFPSHVNGSRNIMTSFVTDAIVCGFHVYSESWSASIGEGLPFTIEPENFRLSASKKKPIQR